VTNDNIGLKVLREVPVKEEAMQIVEYIRIYRLLAPTYTKPPSIIAIHGLGAYPDDSWCKNIGTKEEP
jgi:hypothetical protein